MSELLSRVRHAARSLRRSPGYSALAVLLLGMAIAANSSLLTLSRATLAAPPSGVRNPDELFGVLRTSPEGSSPDLSYADFEFLREHSKGWTTLAACDDGSTILPALLRGRPLRVRVAFVSGDYLALLGVRPTVGRLLGPEDDLGTTSQRVAVLSHRFWQRELAEDPAVVGRALEVGREALTLVGVADTAFRGLVLSDAEPDLWLPIGLRSQVAPGLIDYLSRQPGLSIDWLRVVGRLADDTRPPAAQLAAARFELTKLGDALERDFADWNQGRGLDATRSFQLPPAERRAVQRLLGLLHAAAALILFATVCNLAALTLARNLARQRERALRAALGAKRSRIVAELILESLWLGVLGGLGGFLLASWGTHLLAPLLPLPQGLVIEADLSQLALTLGLAVLASVGFGLLPAAFGQSSDLSTQLKGVSGSLPWPRLQPFLVLAQGCLSALLLVVALLLLRSALATRAVDLGFTTEGLFVAALDLDPLGYDEPRARRGLEQLRQAVAERPGILAVSAVHPAPLSGRWIARLPVQAGAAASDTQEIEVAVSCVAPNYFRTLGLALQAGRDFSELDGADSPAVVIVNRRAADLLWPGGGTALGKTLDRGAGKPGWTVVGVVADGAYGRVGEAPPPQVYRPLSQLFQPSAQLIVRSSSPPAATVAELRAGLAEVDPQLALSAIRPVADAADRQLKPFRSAAILVGLAASLPLALVGLGLFGLLTATVTARARDIAVRLAVGANRSRLALRIVAQGLALVGTGGAIGLGLAWAGSHHLEPWLFRIPARSPGSFLSAAAVLLAVALAACLVPGARALRTEPARLLRQD